MQPLGRDGQVDAALSIRNRETRLGTQRRLVLHADLVLTPDHHVGPRGLVPVADLHLTRDVAAGMELWRVRGQRLFRLGDGAQHLVLDTHLLRRPPRLLGMVGGHDRDRFAPVANEIEGEHRLVLDLEAVELLSRHVLVREHRTNSGHRPRAGRVDGKNPGVGVRAPHRRTPKHSLGMKIG